MNTHRKNLVGALTLALGMGLGMPTFAQEATPWPELMMKMADVDKNGMVSKQEYLDMAARLWDMKHAKMMKEDTAMKSGRMTRTQFMAFAKGLFVDPGQIGGN